MHDVVATAFPARHDLIPLSTGLLLTLAHSSDLIYIQAASRTSAAEDDAENLFAMEVRS